MNRHAAIVVAVTAAVLSLLIIVGARWLGPGRYQVARLSDNVFVRLDTRNGEMAAYMFGRDSDRFSAEKMGLLLFPIASTHGAP
jgi:hypothetical protein